MARVKLKIYDVTDQTSNNFNTHIAEYLKKYGNEIWSVNKIQHENYFSSEIMQKMRQGN